MRTLTRLLSASLGLAVIGSPGLARAQLTPIPNTPYNAGITTGITYQGCPNPTIATNAADTFAADVNIPFPFKYYDRNETTVTLTSNGAISVPATTVSDFTWTTNDPPGSTSTPDGVIAPWWDDNEIFASSNGYVGWSVIGTAPTRIFCVEWKNLSTDNFSTSSSHRINMRILLHEGLAGRIDIEYGTTSGTPGTTVDATVGIEDQSGGRGITWAPPNSSCGASYNLCREDILQALQNTRVTFIQDAGVEVVALGAQAPQFGFLDTAFDLPVRYQSLHGNPIGPFDVAVYAADNEQMNSKVEVGRTTTTLQPFQLREDQISVVVPSALGTQNIWFEIEVDAGGAVPETNEGNNLAVSDSPTRFLQAGPDLTVERVTADATSAQAGDTVTVFSRVSNVGGVAVTGGEVAVMLSTNPAISGQDVELGTFSVDLAVGETVNATTTVTIPSGTNSGRYYLGTVADPRGALDELNESNNGRAALGQLDVAGAGLSVTTVALPRGFLFERYSALLVANGGQLPYTWEVIQGQLPDGVGLVAGSGELFGRPAMEETQTFTVRVSSADGQEATQELTIAIGTPGEPLTIVTRDLAEAVVGQEYAFQLVVTGGTSTSSLSWSFTDGPEDFSITDNGVLVGNPTQIGTFDMTVSVSDGAETAERALTLEVKENATLLIVPAALPAATFAEPYSAQLEAEGGNAPYTWLLQLGNLPAGLTLSPTGELSGTPTQVGSFRFVVEARDSAPGGLAARDVNTFELTVLDVDGFEIVTDSLATGIMDEGYDESIAASGGLAPYEWTIVEGRLPEGLLASADVNTNELRIAGQPTESGITNLLVRATDAQGRSTERALSLVVLEMAPVPPPPPDDGGCTGLSPAGAASTSAWIVALAATLLVLRRRRRR